MTVTSADIGKLVRFRGRGASPHWMRGRLVGITRKSAIVFPFKHKHTETIPIQDVRIWKAKEGGSLA